MHDTRINVATTFMCNIQPHGHCNTRYTILLDRNEIEWKKNKRQKEYVCRRCLLNIYVTFNFFVFISFSNFFFIFFFWAET